MAAAKKKKSGQSNSLALTTEELAALYRKMVLIRRFDEKAGQLYGMGMIGGFCHLYIGQEAVAVGVHSVLEKGKDTIITTYRERGPLLAAGGDPKEAMAELTGRATGSSAGKGGSMHLFDQSRNFYGGHGIVGASAPLGLGLAFAHKYRDDGGVAVAYMGDGAANQGQVFESFNMAVLWKLPILFIIENNQYSMGTALNRHASGDLYRRGEPFGIPGEQVDGMDLFTVREAVSSAVDYVRSGQGPYLLEMKTYRYRGHSMSDPAKYRTKEELQKMKDERDALNTVKERLIADGMAEDDIKALEREVKQIVAEAAEFAQQSPEPAPAELWTDTLIPVEE
ncbi:MAG: pyruvate dehydrogenase (acetyl-transferring) E1 component subunit alpha [Rhodospirillales bacterium]|nr:pyruvate dehydrogenase (acetyl-transferring) E1 component subunit alpha [Rhodospirillales bacterium]